MNKIKVLIGILIGYALIFLFEVFTGKRELFPNHELEAAKGICTCSSSHHKNMDSLLNILFLETETEEEIKEIISSLHNEDLRYFSCIDELEEKYPNLNEKKFEKETKKICPDDYQRMMKAHEDKMEMEEDINKRLDELNQVTNE